MIYLDVDVSENEVFQPNGRTVMANPSQVDSKKNMFFLPTRVGEICWWNIEKIDVLGWKHSVYIYICI